MRVLKALRRTWRTLEQVEHFINCYTRSFFFFFFFERKEKEKCHHYDYFQREQNGRNAAGIPAAFRPGRCVPEGSVRNLCQTAWHQPVVPSTSPSFNTQNTESFFLFKFRLWLRLPADNFFEKKKKMIGRPGPQPHEVAAVAPVGTSSSFFRQLGVSAGGRWQQNDAQRHFHKIRSTLI